MEVAEDQAKLYVSVSSDEFEDAVLKVYNNILRQGDVFQVNLSVRQSKELTGKANRYV